MERDIFDDMIKRVECSYVSDLRYNKKIVESKLKTMDLSLYNESSWKNLHNMYLTVDGVKLAVSLINKR